MYIYIYINTYIYIYICIYKRISCSGWYLGPRPSKSLISDLVRLVHALIVRPHLFVSKNPEKPKKVSVDLTGHTYHGRCKPLVTSQTILYLLFLTVARACRTSLEWRTPLSHPQGHDCTLELLNEGNINDKTIPERDRRVRVFNVTMLKSASRRHLVIDTHRTDLGVT